jgi:outer membrane protein assembly factor BamB
MTTRGLVIAVAITASGLAASSSAQGAPQEWTQWRGQMRNGVLTPAQTPAVWPAAWKARWRVEVGEGYASPVLSQGRLFVHSRRDPREVVTAIDAASGERLWEQSYDAAFMKNQYAAAMAKGPNATPLVAGEHLFTLGVTGILSAWDAKSGRHLWQKDFSPLVDSTKLFCGTAASPLLAHGLVVIQVGSDVKGGQIVALDPVTGQAKWTWTGPGPGYASPALIEIAGTSQVVTMTNSSAIGINARTGAELWSIPFTDEWHENISTPTWTGSHLIVSGIRQGTHGYTITRSGQTWSTAQAWHNDAVGMYMSSPVLSDGTLFGLSARRKGQFVALDVATGALKWASEGRDADHASLLLTASHVIYLTSTGDLLVSKKSAAGFERERQYGVATSPTYAVPLFTAGDLIVRDATGVTRLGGG